MKKVTSSLALLFSSISIVCYSQHEKRETKYSNGRVQESYQVIKTSDGSFKKDGDYKIFFPDGKLRVSGKYIDGKRSGNWKQWYNSGKLQSDVNYRMDTLEGNYNTWFESGAKEFEAKMLKGKYYGHFASWLDNGQPTMDCNYNKSGVMVGVCTEWYSNGQVQWRGTFNEEGRKIGTYLQWYLDGKKQAEINFDNLGQLSGTTKYWNDKGQLYLRREFKDSIDVNLPLSYKTDRGGKLDLFRDGTYSLRHNNGMDNVWNTTRGKFHVTPQTYIPARLILDKFGERSLVKFTRDTIIYKNMAGTNIVYVRTN